MAELEEAPREPAGGGEEGGEQRALRGALRMLEDTRDEVKALR